jgi:hypothetical protein
MRTLVTLAIVQPLLLAACIDPLVSDAVERPTLIRPADAVVLDLLVADPSRRVALAAGDGLPDEDPVLRLRTGFANGKPIAFWDLGRTSPTPIPLYLLVRASDTPDFVTPRGGFSPVGHPPIFDAIPGDPGYSPFWTVVLLPVTDRYAGELLTSFSAVDEAQRRGLASAPITLPVAINCPVVVPEARLERPDGTVAHPSTAYYKGHIVRFFDFDLVGIDPDTGQIPVAIVHELRREGGQPISEPLRGVDFTGDGDLADTNDLFAADRDSPAYTGLVRAVDTVVRADLETLDLTRRPAESALTSVSDLYIGDRADPDVVVALYPSPVVLNRPIAPPPVPEVDP